MPQVTDSKLQPAVTSAELAARRRTLRLLVLLEPVTPPTTG
jgi:hypothetical protein